MNILSEPLFLCLLLTHLTSARSRQFLHVIEDVLRPLPLALWSHEAPVQLPPSLSRALDSVNSATAATTNAINTSAGTSTSTGTTIDAATAPGMDGAQARRARLAIELVLEWHAALETIAAHRHCVLREQAMGVRSRAVSPNAQATGIGNDGSGSSGSVRVSRSAESTLLNANPLQRQKPANEFASEFSQSPESSGGAFAFDDRFQSSASTASSAATDISARAAAGTARDFDADELAAEFLTASDAASLAPSASADTEADTEADAEVDAAWVAPALPPNMYRTLLQLARHAAVSRDGQMVAPLLAAAFASGHLSVSSECLARWMLAPRADAASVPAAVSATVAAPAAAVASVAATAGVAGANQANQELVIRHVADQWAAFVALRLAAAPAARAPLLLLPPHPKQAAAPLLRAAADQSAASAIHSTTPRLKYHADDVLGFTRRGGIVPAPALEAGVAVAVSELGAPILEGTGADARQGSHLFLPPRLLPLHRQLAERFAVLRDWTSLIKFTQAAVDPKPAREQFVAEGATCTIEISVSLSNLFVLTHDA